MSFPLREVGLHASYRIVRIESHCRRAYAVSEAKIMMTRVKAEGKKRTLSRENFISRSNFPTFMTDHNAYTSAVSFNSDDLKHCDRTRC